MDNFLGREYIALEEQLGFYCSRLISYPLISPEHIYFSLTNRCNLRCSMCDIPKTPSKKEDELTLSQIKDIIIQIKDMGIRHIIFSGGEPFLREDLLEIVGFATKNNIEMVDIITNGISLNDDCIQKLISLKLNHITISLDGLKDTNNKIRGDYVFEKAEHGIDRLNYYKSKYSSAFPTVGINFTIMDRNIDDILPMIEFARIKRCNIIVFQPVLFNNTKMYEKKKNILWPSKDNISKLKVDFKKIINLKSTLNDLSIYTDTDILETIPAYFQGKRTDSNFKCYEGIKRVVITFEGKLWSCIGIYGDLKKYDLRTIWYSQEATEMRKKIKKCRAHCLQDCVYLPSDIIHCVDKFLDKLDSNIKDRLKNKEIKKKLLGKVNYYIDILRENLFYQKFLTNIGLKTELKKLYLIRDKLIS